MVTHDTYSPLRTALFGMQNVISTVRATQKSAPSSTSKQALVANPSSRAMAPEKCHSSSRSESVATATKSAKHNTPGNAKHNGAMQTNMPKTRFQLIPVHSTLAQRKVQKIRECTQQQTNVTNSCAHHAKHTRSKSPTFRLNFLRKVQVVCKYELYNAMIAFEQS